MHSIARQKTVENAPSEFGTFGHDGSLTLVPEIDALLFDDVTRINFRFAVLVTWAPLCGRVPSVYSLLQTNIVY